MSRHILAAILRIVLLVLAVPLSARAGVGNPNISVIGQMRAFITDDADDANRERAQISFDESEIMADANLNPYARGTFVFAFSEEEEAGIEEGYVEIVRGLPKGLAAKAGKYRVSFGRLNVVHPHAYPFAERFHVLASYLPGEESFNETGGELSYRLPLPGDVSSLLAANVLQGHSFRPDDAAPSRPAVTGRWATSFDASSHVTLDAGFSTAYGINDPALKTRTALYGFDARMKWRPTARSSLLVQTELLELDRKEGTRDSLTEEITTSHIRPWGGYLFADFAPDRRWNFGARYERFQRLEENEDSGKVWNAAAGLFAGFALMEETTLFRVAWDRFMPGQGEAANTFTLQIVFSMGPHKPHVY